ncbi:conserved hypothetical protein [Candidatus Terasakiella magnetica]|nr:conserved hypothetical protein [Candidatus Terasakiella magnetica]
MPLAVAVNGVAMSIRSETCEFRLVSEAGQRLVSEGDAKSLTDFTRQILACPRLVTCKYGDYCTIFSASLLTERGSIDRDT